MQSATMIGCNSVEIAATVAIYDDSSSGWYFMLENTHGLAVVEVLHLDQVNSY